MKVLFISSGNEGISPIIKAQANSLIRNGVDISFAPTIGKGALGYISNVSKIRKAIKEIKPDIVHAHNIFVGFVCSLAGATPLVVSLMGWNVRKPILRWLIKIFNKFTWDICIVKSELMKKDLGINSVFVIPNGVNLDVFRPMDRKIALEKCGWDSDKTNILFAANPSNPIKNYELAREAVKLVDDNNIILHGLKDILHDEVVYRFNAADVVLFTSLGEGSPNVIKEAMACNSIIVSTNVGDVAERFEGVEGCYLTSYDAEDVADKIRKALAGERKNNAREHVMQLSDDNIAKKIIELYKSLINQNLKEMIS